MKIWTKEKIHKASTQEITEIMVEPNVNTIC